MKIEAVHMKCVVGKIRLGQALHLSIVFTRPTSQKSAQILPSELRLYPDVGKGNSSVIFQCDIFKSLSFHKE